MDALAGISNFLCVRNNKTKKNTNMNKRQGGAGSHQNQISYKKIGCPNSQFGALTSLKHTFTLLNPSPLPKKCRSSHLCISPLCLLKAHNSYHYQSLQFGTFIRMNKKQTNSLYYYLFMSDCNKLFFGFQNSLYSKLSCGYGLSVYGNKGRPAMDTVKRVVHPYQRLDQVSSKLGLDSVAEFDGCFTTEVAQGLIEDFGKVFRTIHLVFVYRGEVFLNLLNTKFFVQNNWVLSQISSALQALKSEPPAGSSLGLVRGQEPFRNRNECLLQTSQYCFDFVGRSEFDGWGWDRQQLSPGCHMKLPCFCDDSQFSPKLPNVVLVPDPFVDGVLVKEAILFKGGTVGKDDLIVELAQIVQFVNQSLVKLDWLWCGNLNYLKLGGLGQVEADASAATGLLRLEYLDPALLRH